MSKEDIYSESPPASDFGEEYDDFGPPPSDSPGTSDPGPPEDDFEDFEPDEDISPPPSDDDPEGWNSVFMIASFPHDQIPSGALEASIPPPLSDEEPPSDDGSDPPPPPRREGLWPVHSL